MGLFICVDFLGELVLILSIFWLLASRNSANFYNSEWRYTTIRLGPTSTFDGLGFEDTAMVLRVDTTRIYGIRLILVAARRRTPKKRHIRGDIRPVKSWHLLTLVAGRLIWKK